MKSRYAKRYRKAKKIKKRDLYGRSFGYAKQMLELQEKIKTEKNDKIEQMKNEINSLSKMDMINYLNHMKEKSYNKKKREMRLMMNQLLKSINKILELKGLISKK